MSEGNDQSIVVGASLVAVFEALRLARAGRRVRVIERASRIGGAWSTMPTAYCEDLNFGTHFFRNHPDVQDFILSRSETEFEPLRPAPVAYWGDLAMREDSAAHQAAMFAHRARRLADQLRGAVPTDEAARERYSRAVLRFPLTLASAVLRRRGVFYYPRRGLGDLLRNLRRQLDREGVELSLETEVLRAEVDRARETVRVETSAGEVLGRELVVFSNTRFARSESFDLAPVEPLGRMRYPHLCLIVEDRAERLFSHANFVHDDMLIRMNDYTPYVTLRPEHRGRPLKILHGWVRDVPYSRAEQAERICERFKRLRCLGAAARLEAFEFFDHEISLNGAPNRAEVNRRHAPVVRMLNTYGLIDGVRDVLHAGA